MFDYPVSKAVFCLLLFSTPQSIESVTSMRLRGVSILADRTSPALSAVQDVLSLKDLEFEHNQRRQINTTSPIKKIEKIKLKGIKISSNKLMDVDFESVALSGESIDVEHFSNKFLKSKNYKTLPRMLASDIKRYSSAKDEASTSSSSIEITDNDSKVLSSGVLVSRLVKDSNDSEIEALVEEKAFKVSKDISALTVASKRIQSVRGTLSLEGGSFSKAESFSYYVERKHMGKTFETTTIQGDAKNFKMDLSGDKGFISAELRSSQGEILAYGEVDLSSGDTQNLDLILEPSAGLFAGQAFSQNSLANNKTAVKENPLAESKTIVAGVDGTLVSDAEGFFGDSNLFSSKSDFLSSTFKKGFWPTLSLSESGKAYYPRLIKRDVIDRLEVDLDPFGEEVSIESLLLGKVTFKGLNRSGLKVEIFNQGYQEPVYFNRSGRPDTSLKQTSTHGGFVFANLPDGGYLVQVVQSEKVVAQKWFVVKSGHISRGQIELKERDARLVFLESYPVLKTARNRNEIYVRELGLDKEDTINIDSLEAEIKGLELKSRTQPSLTVLEVLLANSNESKLRNLVVLPSKSSRIALKHVSSSWLNSFLNRQRSNRTSSLGLIVGFIEDKDFEVLKDVTEAVSASSEIFYFNRQGQPTSKGEKGGGFVITNTKLGFQPLVIRLEEDKFLNKVVFTSSNSVSVF